MLGAFKYSLAQIFFKNVIGNQELPNVRRTRESTDQMKKCHNLLD